ncbi:MAG: Fic family protein [Burkholderiaceae bacterium]
MGELVTWLNEARDLGRLHPLLIVAVFIVVFLEIHPFQDGNGRLSRILTTLLLLQGVVMPMCRTARLKALSRTARKATIWPCAEPKAQSARTSRIGSPGLCSSCAPCSSSSAASPSRSSAKKPSSPICPSWPSRFSIMSATKVA